MTFRWVSASYSAFADRSRKASPELFNLLINPVAHDFALRWHRDDVKNDATEEEESQALKLWHHGVCSVVHTKELSDIERVYYRCNGTRMLNYLWCWAKMVDIHISALYDDSCLYVVPGTHKQPRTNEQRIQSSTMEAPSDPFDMPGAIPVHLKGKFQIFLSVTPLT